MTCTELQISAEVLEQSQPNFYFWGGEKISAEFEEGLQGISEICVGSASVKGLMYDFNDEVGYSFSRFYGIAIWEVHASILSSFVC